MSKWYIDRSRNIGSIVSSIHFNLLKDLISNEDDENNSIDTNDLIDLLQIDGANKNALLTNFRDLGLINTTNNKPSSFFITCVKSNISLNSIVLLILLKRNDDKNGASFIKPFVLMAKTLSLMIEQKIEPVLTWGLCDNYLMKLNNYSLNWEQIKKENEIDRNVLTTPVLDIWFNALIATGLFTGNSKKVYLKKEYYNFINFIARYGDEMIPNQNREDYVVQACDSKYGWYSLFKNHAFEAVNCIGNLPDLLSYIQTAENIGLNHIANRVNEKSKDELENELYFLTQQLENIKVKINNVKNDLKILSYNDRFSNIKVNVQNKDLFAFYLMNTKGLKDITIHDYYISLEKCKDLLDQYCNIKLKTEFYFIDDINILEELISIFMSNEDLKNINRINYHHAISAALNNYLAFLKAIEEIG